MSAPMNPAAFPRPGVSDGIDLVGGQTGMTLRDWFAGQALAGLMVEGDQVYKVAELAYSLADAMLAVREGGAA